MRIGQQKSLKAVAAVLVFSLAQIGVQISFAEANRTAPSVLPIPQQLIVAKLERLRGTAITVNGNGVTTGATITTGSMIETGNDTGATINLGSIGTLDIAPNTRLELTYDDQGNVKLRLITGCAILRTKKKTNGEVVTESGTSAGKTPTGGGVLDICIPSGGGNPLVNQGAAAAAGAGAGAAAIGTGTAAATAGFWTPGVIAAVVGGIAAGVIIPIVATSGAGGPNVQGNPSPGSAQ